MKNIMRNKKNIIFMSKISGAMIKITEKLGSELADHCRVIKVNVLKFQALYSIIFFCLNFAFNAVVSLSSLLNGKYIYIV